MRIWSASIPALPPHWCDMRHMVDGVKGARLDNGVRGGTGLRKRAARALYFSTPSVQKGCDGQRQTPDQARQHSRTHASSTSPRRIRATSREERPSQIRNGPAQAVAFKEAKIKKISRGASLAAKGARASGGALLRYLAPGPARTFPRVHRPRAKASAPARSRSGNAV